MSIAGLLISFIIVAAVVAWVMIPFLFRQDTSGDETASVERQRERLLVYYERVLRNLHDIDEDFATGKLSEAEHRIERERWAQRGIQALKALDQLDTQHLVAPSAADNAAIDEAIEQAIETTLADYRNNPTQRVNDEAHS